ncbi:MAG: hypothetical protein H7Y20_00705 [Bryobacteraceae bacterium]|nr:hypothetical protein [Bryobacteraceae bacterium]
MAHRAQTNGPVLTSYMSFLDNLESSLKNLEGNNERGGNSADRRRHRDDRAHALAIAPNAEALKKSPFVNDLLTHAVRIAHGMRVKVNMIWLGSTLRLDARELRLELQPTEDGLLAVFFEDGQQTSVEPLDLQGDAEALATKWLLTGVETAVEEEESEEEQQ